MMDELLRYYNEELDYVRRVGNEFSKRHPKIARGLCLDQHVCEDPLVARLIEAFAFLNAKIRCQLDADYAELAHSLLTLLYPAAVSPIPAMATIQFIPSEHLCAQHTIERHTMLDAKSSASASIHFRTGYPVTLWPLAVQYVSVQPSGAIHVDVPSFDGVKACVSVQIHTTHADYHVAVDPPDRLRFYIMLQKHYANRLYHYLFQHMLHIIVRDPSTKQCITLSCNALQAVGFHADEALLCYPQQTVPGLNLLIEYSLFQDKFMYFDITGLQAALLQLQTDHIELLLLMDYFAGDLASIVNAQTLRLGCTPIINLFASQSEPLHIQHQHTAYPVYVDQRYARHTTEIVQVQALHGWAQSGDALAFRPLYGLSYTELPFDQHLIAWEALRQPAWQVGVAEVSGDEIQLRFMTEKVDALHEPAWTVYADLLCMNRGLPHDIAFLQGECYTTQMLSQPTASVRPLPKNKNMPYLLSAMTLIQTALTDATMTIACFKQALVTLNTAHSEEFYFIIEKMQHLTLQPCMLRFPKVDTLLFVSGMHLDIVFHEFDYAEQELYLFGRMLSCFLNQFCALNSFITLSFSLHQKGCIGRWEPLFN